MCGGHTGIKGFGGARCPGLRGVARAGYRRATGLLAGRPQDRKQRAALCHVPRSLGRGRSKGCRWSLGRTPTPGTSGWRVSISRGRSRTLCSLRPGRWPQTPAKRAGWACSWTAAPRGPRVGQTQSMAPAPVGSQLLHPKPKSTCVRARHDDGCWGPACPEAGACNMCYTGPRAA